MEDLYTHYAGNIELSMTLEDAKKCSHQGYCDNDVHEVTQYQYIQEQLKDYLDEDIKEALKEYTIECDNLDRTDMEEYITWIVACNITDDEINN